MSPQLDFELQAAHQYFSTYCFNQAWELLEKKERSSEEDQEILCLSIASHWHWTQRNDYTPLLTLLSPSGRFPGSTLCWIGRKKPAAGGISAWLSAAATSWRRFTGLMPTKPWPGRSCLLVIWTGPAPSCRKHGPSRSRWMTLKKTMAG